MRADSPEWLKSKAKGDRAELLVAEWFRGRGYLVAKTVGAESFDLLLQAHVEVKHDLRAVQSGRIAVEIRHRGQASGLLSTSATWWAIVVGDEAFLMKTDALRACVLSGKYQTKSGGDGQASEFVLVPIVDVRGLEHVFVIQLNE